MARPRTRLLLLTALLFTAAAAGVRAEPSEVLPWRWSGVERIVAIGDVHGAYPELVKLLEDTGLIDGDLHWSGGSNHLVLLGDLLDRGPRSREVLDLLMALQQEAAAAGGRVHVLLGNHEVMNLVGDLRYVGHDELSAYQADEDEGVRRAALQRLLDRYRLPRKQRSQKLEELERTYPPGFYALQRLLSPKGRYGSWLLDQRLLVVINNIAFVHGGLAPVLLDIKADELNAQALAELRAYLEARHYLLEAGLLEPEMPLPVQKMVIDRLQGELQASVPTGQRYRHIESAVRTMLRFRESPVFGPDGPLWYRGTSLNPDLEERDLSKQVLEHLGAAAVVVGHTPVHTRRITTRFSGRVIRADTGMLYSHYRGRPAAVVISPAGLYAFYPEEGLSPLPARELGLGDALMLADAQIEAILRDAEVIQTKEVGSGSTQPLQLVLAHAGQQYRAIFKEVDHQLPQGDDDGAEAAHERYRFEAAAYRLDRLLGLGMVPPTVLRTVHDRNGSVQLWVEHAISEKDRRWEDLEPPAEHQERFKQQLNRMHLLDLLIHNPDRDQTNILVTTHDWQLHLIDHARSFGLVVPPSLAGSSPEIDNELRARLKALDARTLRHALGGLLNMAERQALLERRDLLLTPPPATP